MQIFLFPVSLNFLDYNLFFYQRIGASTLGLVSWKLAFTLKMNGKFFEIYMEKKMPVLCDVL